MNDTLTSITYSELCQIEGLKGELIIASVEYGIVKPIQRAQDKEWIFEPGSVYWIKKASRLHTDLEIDWVAVSMVIELLKHNAELKKENARIKRLLKRFMESD